MRGRTVSGREAFSWYDEGGCVRAEVKEELCKNVEGKETLFAEGMIREADDDENDCQKDEAHELDRLAADGVNSRHSHPVTGDSTSTDDDQIADSSVAEDFIHVAASSVADLLENDGVVETKTVKGDVKEKPRSSSSEKDLSVPPLAVVAPEIGPRRLRGVKFGSLHDRYSTHLIRMPLTLALYVGFYIFLAFLDIASDIKGVAGSFRDGQTIVEGDTSWDGTEPNDDTPRLVDRELANTTAVGDFLGGLERFFETRRTDERDDGRGELADTLHGEDGAHHSTSPFRSSKPEDAYQQTLCSRVRLNLLRCDDRRQGIIAADTDAHKDTPEDEDTND